MLISAASEKFPEFSRESVQFLGRTVSCASIQAIVLLYWDNLALACYNDLQEVIFLSWVRHHSYVLHSFYSLSDELIEIIR